MNEAPMIDVRTDEDGRTWFAYRLPDYDPVDALSGKLRRDELDTIRKARAEIDRLRHAVETFSAN